MNLGVSTGLWAVLLGSVSCWPSLLFRWALVKVVVPEKREEGGRVGERGDSRQTQSGRQDGRQQWGRGGGTDSPRAPEQKKGWERRGQGARSMGEKHGKRQREKVVQLPASHGTGSSHVDFNHGGRSPGSRHRASLGLAKSHSWRLARTRAGSGPWSLFPILSCSPTHTSLLCSLG